MIEPTRPLSEITDPDIAKPLSDKIKTYGDLRVLGDMYVINSERFGVPIQFVLSCDPIGINAEQAQQLLEDVAAMGGDTSGLRADYPAPKEPTA